MIVDTHVHVLVENQPRYPRGAATLGWAQEVTLPAEKLLDQMREAGIDRTVLVQAWGAYRYDNSYAADSAVSHPKHFASVCILDPLPKDAPDQLTYWVKERGVRGIRLFPDPASPTNWLDDPQTFPMWERIAALRVPVCVFTRFAEVGKLAAPLQRFPQVPVALDHMGMPDLKEGPPYRGLQALFDLARFPNLHMKFSTVTVMASSAGKSTPKEFFNRALDRFGPRRMMWGSNYPATPEPPLKQQLALAQETLAFLSAEDRRWLFGETALTLWPQLRG